MEIFDILDSKSQEQVRRFSMAMGCIIMVLALLGFWTGIDFLKEDVYKGYFNPSRHVIVEQDPDTGEIYIWKDAIGNVYTPDNRDVKLFPYGVMILILVIMLTATSAYNLMKEHYVMMVFLQQQLGKLPERELQRISKPVEERN